MNKSKGKPVLLPPKYPPDSFSRDKMIKAIKKVRDARERRKQSTVAHGSK